MPVQKKIEKDLKKTKSFFIFFHSERIFWASLVLITLFFTTSMYFFVWRRFQYTETELVPLSYSLNKSIISSREELARRELLVRSEENISTLSWDRLHFFLPSSSQFPRLILELASLATQNGFELEALHLSNEAKENTSRSSFSSTVRVNGITPVSLEITVQGKSGYQAFAHFMASLLSSLRFLEITNFSYVPGNESYTFSLRGFWFEPAIQIKENGKKENITVLTETMENFFKNEKFLRLKTWNQDMDIVEGKEVYSKGGIPENRLELHVSDPGNGESIVLSWNGSDMEGKKIHLFKTIDPASSSDEIIGVSADVSYYIDQDVSANRPYYYRATIEDAEGNISSPTNLVVGIAHDQTPPSLPQELRFETLGNGKVILYWKNPEEEDFDSVNIYRSEDEKNLGVLVGAKISSESFEDVFPKKGATYYYFFSSVDTRGNESTIIPLKDLVGKSLPFE